MSIDNTLIILVDLLEMENDITPLGPRGYNVFSSNFQSQILGRVKQISIFCKLGSCRVNS